MDNRETTIELLRYDSINKWKPEVGDVIIRHGFFIRTKWFGVINSITHDGSLSILKGGLLQLVIQARKKDEFLLHPSEITSAINGSYTICKNGVWYI